MPGRGFALPAKAAASRDSVYAFLEYASRPEVDAAVVEGLQAYSPIAASNAGIHDPVAREFLPMFDDAITSAQLALGAGDRRRDRQPGPGPREGRHRPGVGRRRPSRPSPTGSAFVGSQLLPADGVAAACLDARARGYSGAHASPLLETKLYAPRPRSGLVPRPRLTERLDRGTESKLTLVSAPAGFGKTTLLAEWLAARPAAGLGHGMAVARRRRQPSESRSGPT